MANLPEPLTRMEALLAAILYCVSSGEYGYVPSDEPEPAPDDGDGGDGGDGGDDNGGGE